MNNLPKEIIIKIWEYDNTYFYKFNECLKEIIIKKNFINIIHDISNLKYMPNYKIPKIFI